MYLLLLQWVSKVFHERPFPDTTDFPTVSLHVTEGHKLNYKFTFSTSKCEITRKLQTEWIIWFPMSKLEQTFTFNNFDHMHFCAHKHRTEPYSSIPVLQNMDAPWKKKLKNQNQQTNKKPTNHEEPLKPPLMMNALVGFQQVLPQLYSLQWRIL